MNILKTLPAVLFMIVFPVYSNAEVFTQSYSMESSRNSSEGAAQKVETDFSPPAIYSQPEPEKKEEPQTNIINVYPQQTPISGAVYRITAPAPDIWFNTGGYSYSGYSGIYYGSNGKKYIQTPWTPVMPKTAPPPNGQHDHMHQGGGTHPHPHHHQGAPPEHKKPQGQQ